MDLSTPTSQAPHRMDGDLPPSSSGHPPPDMYNDQHWRMNAISQPYLPSYAVQQHHSPYLQPPALSTQSPMMHQQEGMQLPYYVRNVPSTLSSPLEAPSQYGAPQHPLSNYNQQPQWGHHLQPSISTAMLATASSSNDGTSALMVFLSFLYFLSCCPFCFALVSYLTFVSRQSDHDAQCAFVRCRCRCPALSPTHPIASSNPPFSAFSSSLRAFASPARATSLRAARSQRGSSSQAFPLWASSTLSLTASAYALLNMFYTHF